MSQKESFAGRVNRFVHKHPVLTNFFIIIVVAIVVVWLMLSVFLGSWTRHGDTVRVPGVEGMPVNAAISMLHQGGFEVEVDSIYDAVSGRHGIVVDQSPKKNTVVKEGRTIYLIYACYTQKLVKVPAYYNMSRRQATAAFEEVGLTNITVKDVPSEHADLVLGARYNGLYLQPGKEIPIGANIVLEVGAGVRDEYGDEAEDEELVLPEDADAEFIRQLEQELQNI